MPGRDKRCFPAKRPHGPPNGVCSGYLGALSWLLKRVGLEAVHLELVPSSRMLGVILPLPQVTLMAWSLIEQGGQFDPLRYEQCHEPNISALRHCKLCATDDLSDCWS
jgi:hypothetical protein